MSEMLVGFWIALWGYLLPVAISVGAIVGIVVILMIIELFKHRKPSGNYTGNRK